MNICTNRMQSVFFKIRVLLKELGFFLTSQTNCTTILTGSTVSSELHNSSQRPLKDASTASLWCSITKCLLEQETLGCCFALDINLTYDKQSDSQILLLPRLADLCSRHQIRNDVIHSHLLLLQNEKLL